MSSTLLRWNSALRRAIPARAVRPAMGMASTKFVRGLVTLPDLPYDYGALEPYISGKIMEVHHSKHHDNYVSGLNKAIEAIAEAESRGDYTRAASMAPVLNFCGGGHVNHSLFWENLAPANKGGGGEPKGELLEAIELDFGAFHKLQKRMQSAFLTIQGSGWVWLVKDKDNGNLSLVLRENQDPVFGNQIPLLGIDAWEHAYYLQYQSRKVEYLTAIWNVINWRTVSKRFKADV